MWYSDRLTKIEPDRTLYLAIRNAVFHNLFEEDIGQILLKNQRIRCFLA